MLAVNYSTVRDKLKTYCDKVTDENETVIVTRKNEKNVVILSLQAWNEMQKQLRNAEYLNKINRSVADVNANHVIMKSLNDLEALEK